MGQEYLTDMDNRTDAENYLTNVEKYWKDIGKGKCNPSPPLIEYDPNE